MQVEEEKTRNEMKIPYDVEERIEPSGFFSKKKKEYLIVSCTKNKK
jgi:hypothetical protein